MESQNRSSSDSEDDTKSVKSTVNSKSKKSNLTCLHGLVVYECGSCSQAGQVQVKQVCVFVKCQIFLSWCWRVDINYQS